jgi:exodeoxyribonuclease V alpha subunit
MIRSRSRALNRFLNLKSVLDQRPDDLNKRLQPPGKEDDFRIKAPRTGALPLWIESSSYMVGLYGESRREELRILLLYFLEMSSRGHIRISAEDLAEDFPLWSEPAWPGKGALVGELPSIVRENPALFAELDAPGTAAVRYAPDLSCFYLLKKLRFERSFLELLKGFTGGEGSLEFPEEQRRLIPSLYQAVKEEGAIPVGEETLQALEALLSSRLSVITGGPGTGKTTILAGLLKLFLSLHRETGSGMPEVRLCAPTGRAARRMEESMEHLLKDPSLAAAFVHPAQTLHKTLGIRPGRTPRFGDHRSLGADLIVVDEASMVDLNMMTLLLGAMKPGSRLVLVGDRDQLPSVESGALLSDLLYRSDEQDQRLADRVLSLTRVHRNSGAILEASRMVISGDFPAFAAFLDDPVRREGSSEPGRFHFALMPGQRELLEELAGRFREGGIRPGDRGFDGVFRDWESYREDMDSFFALYRQLAVLSPTRKGLYGTAAINRGLDRLLGSREGHYHGRPLMVVRNDYERGLFNGDRGVVFSFSDGFYAFFEDGEGGYRGFPCALLEDIEAAYAITIHKSQGSEYGEVLLLMPEGSERMLSREILYTGITRAREGVRLYAAGTEVLALCLARGVRRMSGIREFMLASPIEE